MSGVGDSTDALVPSARWQESENSMRGVGGVIHNAGGFVSAALVKGGVYSLYPDDLLSCPHNFAAGSCRLKLCNSHTK